MAISSCSVSSWVPLPKLASFKIMSHPNSGRPNSLTLKACFFKYPLASKVMVRNLSYSTSESSLQKEFSRFGPIAEVKLVKDEETKKSKGYAFIQYASQEEALLALDSMDRKYIDGRIIFVELAKLKKDDFGASAKASGPPKKYSPTEDEDE